MDNIKQLFATYGWVAALIVTVVLVTLVALVIWLFGIDVNLYLERWLLP